MEIKVERCFNCQDLFEPEIMVKFISRVTKLPTYLCPICTGEYERGGRLDNTKYSFGIDVNEI